MKVLLAVDGSRFSDAATRSVVSQVRPGGAEVLVLQVVEARGPELGTTSKERFRSAQDAVERAAQALCSAGFSATTRTLEAEAREGILQVAAEWLPDLIVMGSHGRSGIAKFFLGSVAESVLRHAQCSVLIVRAPT
jgi:nucleotide-binding universal stress UspA family protein